jgi:hypothetical protein
MLNEYESSSSERMLDDGLAVIIAVAGVAGVVMRIFRMRKVVHKICSE